MFSLLCVGCGFALAIGLYLAARRGSSYQDVTLYEVTDRMLPVDRELLLDIVRESQMDAHPRTSAYDYRRQLRLHLEDIQDQLQRILINAARPRNWAACDWRIINKHRLEHPPDSLRAMQRVLETERELRSLVRWILFRVWLWNLSGFQRRSWGPLPDIQRFRIAEALDAYERVKLAAIHLARCWGEAAVAEEIDALM